MPEAISILMEVIFAIVLCAVVGSVIARRNGRSPVLGFVIGGAIPVVGVGLLLLLGSRDPARRV
jgi:Kef-type K+ transport system membrane component KefB